MNSIFAVNKPTGMTSHDVVNRVRKITGEKRVGHGGTLDPLASGVLIIAVGRENTKKLDEYVKGEKEYVATIKLGFESATDDSEGPITEVPMKTKPTSEEVHRILTHFVGDIEQTPPVYSAMRVNGSRAYKEARKGKTPAMQARTVHISDIELLEYTYPFLKIRVTTGPGTYIRSLARDIGKKLKAGAYITELIRTRVNTFTLETAFDLEKLTN